MKFGLIIGEALHGPVGLRLIAENETERRDLTQIASKLRFLGVFVKTKITRAGLTTQASFPLLRVNEPGFNQPLVDAVLFDKQVEILCKENDQFKIEMGPNSP